MTSPLLTTNKPDLRLDERGATLLEFVLYVGLLGIILISATLFAGEFVLSQAKSASIMEATRNARIAAARISLEIREASGVNAGSSTFGVHPGVISLASTVPSWNPTTISVSGGALMIQQGAGAPVALTSPNVVINEFIVDSLSTGVKTRAFRLRIKADYNDPSGLTPFVGSAVIETTATLERDHGFGP